MDYIDTWGLYSQENPRIKDIDLPQTDIYLEFDFIQREKSNYSK